MSGKSRAILAIAERFAQAKFCLCNILMANTLSESSVL